MLESSVRYLLYKFFRNQCTPAEKVELARWIKESAHDATLKEILEDAWKEYEPIQSMSGLKAEAFLADIFKQEEMTEQTLAARVPVKHIWWKGLSVAAILILVLGAGTYFLVFNDRTQKIAKETKQPVLISNDAFPGKQQAILTLSDGSQIILDSASNGTLPKQGYTNIINKKGELVYYSPEERFPTILYNTLTTHRGQLYPLGLSDGSKVWLNSASSIRFPVAFYGKDRMVEVTGEAYFEVAKNPNKPFKVKLNGMEIEVLGTHFNVNAYADESIIKTTLLEGSVKITGANTSLLLSPGQQAGLVSNKKIELIKQVDMEEAVSWKDGYFHFKNASLQTVMRQLSRWYDVDVVYETKEPVQFFGGDIERNLNLSQVLKILERSQVHAKINGNKLIVVH
ncbi:MAG: FecR domain-containing protein [Chitinophagaceae bacterium]